jgi:hypothetical protein
MDEAKLRDYIAENLEPDTVQESAQLARSSIPIAQDRSMLATKVAQYSLIPNSLGPLLTDSVVVGAWAAAPAEENGRLEPGGEGDNLEAESLLGDISSVVGLGPERRIEVGEDLEEGLFVEVERGRKEAESSG